MMMTFFMMPKMTPGKDFTLTLKVMGQMSISKIDLIIGGSALLSKRTQDAPQVTTEKIRLEPLALKMFSYMNLAIMLLTLPSTTLLLDHVAMTGA